MLASKNVMMICHGEEWNCLAFEVIGVDAFPYALTEAIYGSLKFKPFSNAAQVVDFG